jgi:type IV pilus assembly protein PilB
MGVKTFLLPATINAIIAQRLVRRINPEKCIKKPFSELDINLQQRVKNVIATTPKEEIKARLSDAVMQNPGFMVPDMTKVKNSDQAYEGRIALYEVMEITAGIKEMIMKEAPARDIFAAAVRDGMISLEQDGIIRALQGVTTLEEVYGAVRMEA